MRMKKGILPFFLVMVLCSACGSAQPSSSETAEHSCFAMNTYITMQASGADAARVLNETESLILELEGIFSVTEEESELYALNHSNGQPQTVSSGTEELLSFALEIAEETEGSLDPTIYPLLTAWGFTTENRQVPEQEEIQSLLEQVDYTRIRMVDDTVTVPSGMALDLGAVAKGYTGDQAAAYIKEQGITSALINLGGNVQAVGTKPDGSPWRIGLRDPFSEGNVGTLTVENSAVVTSGGYQNYFMGEDGQVYWHILDPDTGYPARTGLASVTVVAPEGVKCDALSTALFVMGLDGALDYWRAHGDFELILITEDREIYLTPGLEDTFTLSDNAEGFVLEVAAP